MAKLSSMKKIKVFDKQNILDIAVQEYGTVEDVFLILEQNEIGFDKNIDLSKNLEIPVSDLIKSDITGYLVKLPSMLATDTDVAQEFYYNQMWSESQEDIFDGDYEYDTDLGEIIASNITITVEPVHIASEDSEIFIPYSIENNNDIPVDVVIQGYENEVIKIMTLPANSVSNSNFEYTHQYGSETLSLDFSIVLGLSNYPGVIVSKSLTIQYSGQHISDTLSQNLVFVNGNQYSSGDIVDVPVGSYPFVTFSNPSMERFVVKRKIIENGNVVGDPNSKMINTLNNDSNLWIYSIGSIDNLRTLVFNFYTSTGVSSDLAELTFNPI